LLAGLPETGHFSSSAAWAERQKQSDAITTAIDEILCMADNPLHATEIDDCSCTDKITFICQKVNRSR
jgi:hypothetical protein